MSNKSHRITFGTGSGPENQYVWGNELLWGRDRSHWAFLLIPSCSQGVCIVFEWADGDGACGEGDAFSRRAARVPGGWFSLPHLPKAGWE